MTVATPAEEGIQASTAVQGLGGNAVELANRLGYPALNEMQMKVAEAGLLSAKSLVVSAPTASGKTLLALTAIADNFLQKKGKAIYIVPLRALAQEKFDEFSSGLSQFNCLVGISTGDLDESSEELGSHDVLIVTGEKMDSLLRHNVPWIKQVSLVVCDEAHLLHDDERGPTLEIVLSKLRQLAPRFICLSATIPNASEIAEWLGATLVESAYRPTKLFKGICSNGSLSFHGSSIADNLPEKTAVSEKKPLEELVEKALSHNNDQGQALIFVSTRRNAEAVAQALCSTVNKTLDEGEKGVLELLAAKALKTLQTPTPQCRALSACLKSGIAFHHAGLESAKRRLIEQGFKKQHAIKAIVCTTTLAMGIDYPASWVIVRDLKRFTGFSSEFIPNLECQQMLGRAGRPRYDEKGFAVMMCAEKDEEEVREKYVLGPLERIYSKLSSEPALRSHSLALLASNYCNDFKTLAGFFKTTFFAHQYGSIEALATTIERVLAQLEEMDFVRRKGEKIVATPVGKRVSELYLDPLTAYAFLSFIKSDSRGKRKSKQAFSYLMALCSASELQPLLSVRKPEEKALWEEMYGLFDDDEINWDDYYALQKFKTAKALNAWINEATEDEIMQSFELPPGIMHSLRSNAEWLAYAMQELAFLENRTTEYRDAKVLRKRILKGIKEELMPLCSFRGIGRARARRLWNAGIRTKEEVEATPKERIKAIIGARQAIEENQAI